MIDPALPVPLDPDKRSAKVALCAPAPPRPELAALLEKARHHKMTPQEIWDQRVSFVYGNAMENPRITREMVEASCAEEYGPRPPTSPPEQAPPA